MHTTRFKNLQLIQSNLWISYKALRLIAHNCMMTKPVLTRRAAANEIMLPTPFASPVKAAVLEVDPAAEPDAVLDAPDGGEPAVYVPLLEDALEEETKTPAGADAAQYTRRKPCLHWCFSIRRYEERLTLPTSSIISTTIACVRGHISDVLRITVLPHIIGTVTARMANVTGAFQGTIPKLSNMMPTVRTGQKTMSSEYTYMTPIALRCTNTWPPGMMD